MKKNQLFFGLVILFFVACFPIVVNASVNPYVTIDGGEARTYDREVKLSIQGKTDSKYMQISNSSDFSSAKWEEYSTSKTWWLDYGKGTKNVYVRFKNNNSTVSSAYKDTITLYAATTLEADFVINPDNDEDDDGASETNSRYVTIRLDYSQGVEGYIVSNNNNFSDKDYSPITSDKISWILTSETGDKTVYVKFIDVDGRTVVANKKIHYEQGSDFVEGGTLLKGQTSSIYYLGYDGQLHPFLNGLIYHSWYEDFEDLKYVSNLKLAQYKMGEPVCVRQGTWLLKFKGLSKVYAVEPGCFLKPIASEAEAYIIYGKNWASRVLELDTAYMSGYKVLAIGEEPGYGYETTKTTVETNVKPYILSINFNSNADDENIDKGDSIIIKFSEPIKTSSINTYLVEGDYLTSISSSKTGGVSVAADGRVTIKNIASFDIGDVEKSGSFTVRLSLNQLANTLTINLTDGSDIEITDFSFSSTKQIGGTVKDVDGAAMASVNISNPNSGSDSNNVDDDTDNDRDGLSYTVEKKYGTSDKKEDTDGDNLTDYEEINYWFSDPIDPDTDGDGYKDGSEIVSGYSPSGPQKLDNSMENKYMYPLGSLVKGKTSGKIYYRDYDGKFYYVGTKKSDKIFSTNNFQEKFIVNETFNISFSSSGTLKSSLDRVKIPQMYNGYYLTNL